MGFNAINQLTKATVNVLIGRRKYISFIQCVYRLIERPNTETYNFKSIFKVYTIKFFSNYRKLKLS